MPIDDARDEEVGATAEEVTCPPVLRHHPIAGPHNTGYDPSWSDFRCDGSLANSDYGGDHHGIDIFAPRGTLVVSPVDGVVLRAGVASASSGNRVTVQDGCGWAYYHGHLDTIVVPAGARIHAGDPIGTVGNTGTPTSPHVHFNVDRDGDYYDDIDPLPVLLPVEGSSCGPDPECASRADGAFCVDGTHRGTCTGGRYEVGDCGFYGTICDMDTGVGRCTPHLDGAFLGSDFAGGVRIEVPVGEEVHGCLTYLNTGAWDWTPELTRLGTTEPRDRASDHRASDWLAPNRLAAVEAVTPRGAQGRFCFSLHGAASPGEREENFSLVHETFFWAADVGGVADSVNRLTVVTTAARPPEMGIAPDADAGPAFTDDAGRMAESPAPGPEVIHGSCSIGFGRPCAPALAGVALALLLLMRRRRR